MYPRDQKIKKNERKHTEIKQHGFLQLFLKIRTLVPNLKQNKYLFRFMLFQNIINNNRSTKYKIKYFFKPTHEHCKTNQTSTWIVLTFDVFENNNTPSPPPPQHTLSLWLSHCSCCSTFILALQWKLLVFNCFDIMKFYLRNFSAPTQFLNIQGAGRGYEIYEVWKVPSLYHKPGLVAGLSRPMHMQS